MERASKSPLRSRWEGGFQLQIKPMKGPAGRTSFWCKRWSQSSRELEWEERSPSARGSSPGLGREDGRARASSRICGFANGKADGLWERQETHLHSSHGERRIWRRTRRWSRGSVAIGCWGRREGGARWSWRRKRWGAGFGAIDNWPGRFAARWKFRTECDRA